MIFIIVIILFEVLNTESDFSYQKEMKTLRECNIYKPDIREITLKFVNGKATNEEEIETGWFLSVGDLCH